MNIIINLNLIVIVLSIFGTVFGIGLFVFRVINKLILTIETLKTEIVQLKEKDNWITSETPKFWDNFSLHAKHIDMTKNAMFVVVTFLLTKEFLKKRKEDN